MSTPVKFWNIKAAFIGFPGKASDIITVGENTPIVEGYGFLVLIKFLRHT